MASWQDRYWTSRDGLRLHYRDYAGLAGRPPILCLHGLTRNHRDFDNLADRYAGDWRVLAVDFRGRGMSDHDPVPARYVPPVYAADLLQLLEELAIPEAVFVGTSLGGLVTMIIAATAPQHIAAAVLNDVGPELHAAGLDRIRSYVGQPVLFRDWGEAAKKLEEKYADVHPGYGQADWVRYAKRVCRETPQGIELDYDMAIAAPFKHMDTQPVPDAWPLFRALSGKPLLILRGEKSDLFSAETAEKMRDEIPGAELVTVPNVGHAPDFDEQEALHGVDRLLQRVLAR